MIYWMNVSLDGYIEHAAGEDGGGDWLRIGEQLHGEFNRRARALDVMVQGRVLYEIMEDAWPGFAADPSAPDWMQEYGRIWIDTPKLLVSNTRGQADWNTRIVGGSDAIDHLAELRASTDGTIGVGGATLATGVLEAGLLDELLLFTHPVVLGSGRPLFDRLARPLQFELLEAGQFKGGVTMHRYAIA